MFEPEIRSESGLSALWQAVAESGNRELACRVMFTCGSNIQVEVDDSLPVGIPWCVEVYSKHTEELLLLIHNVFTVNDGSGVSRSEEAYFLGQIKDLVTLTRLELNMAYGKLVYTCTTCT